MEKVIVKKELEKMNSLQEFLVSRIFSDNDYRYYNIEYKFDVNYKPIVDKIILCIYRWFGELDLTKEDIVIGSYLYDKKRSDGIGTWSKNDYNSLCFQVVYIVNKLIIRIVKILEMMTLMIRRGLFKYKRWHIKGAGIGLEYVILCEISRVRGLGLKVTASDPSDWAYRFYDNEDCDEKCALITSYVLEDYPKVLSLSTPHVSLSRKGYRRIAHYHVLGSVYDSDVVVYNDVSFYPEYSRFAPRFFLESGKCEDKEFDVSDVKLAVTDDIVLVSCEFESSVEEGFCPYYWDNSLLNYFNDQGASLHPSCASLFTYNTTTRWATLKVRLLADLIIELDKG